jgi:hypothetical protein
MRDVGALTRHGITMCFQQNRAPVQNLFVYHTQAGDAMMAWRNLWRKAGDS